MWSPWSAALAFLPLLALLACSSEREPPSPEVFEPAPDSESREVSASPPLDQDALPPIPPLRAERPAESPLRAILDEPVDPGLETPPLETLELETLEAPDAGEDGAEEGEGAAFPADSPHNRRPTSPSP